VRHRKLRTKVRGNSSHNHALYNNMLLGLIEHGHVKTTENRARVLRSMVEKMVTRATRLRELLLKDRTKLPDADKARVIHAMRIAKRSLRNHAAVMRLFDEIAPRYLGRPGGYTRINKLGNRRGDNAPMALLEFVAAEMPEREGRAPAPEETPKKSRLGFLRGKKKDTGEAKKQEE